MIPPGEERKSRRKYEWGGSRGKGGQTALWASLSCLKLGSLRFQIILSLSPSCSHIHLLFFLSITLSL